MLYFYSNINVLQKDSQFVDAKNVILEKGKKSGRKNGLPNRKHIINNWERFGYVGHARAEQKAAVLSFCLTHPVIFIYETKMYDVYSNLLRLWTPFSLGSIPMVRIGARNYGGHIMAEPGNKGIAMGIGDHYPEWNFQMAERGFTVYQFGETVSEPPKKHSNLKFFKLSWSKENVANAINGMFSAIETESKDIVMQMDIRGKEWDLFDKMTESQLYHFRQMSIDFHGLKDELKLEFYTDIFKKLNKTHRIIHLQYNNNVSILCFKDFLISDVMRITYVRRDVGEFSVSEESFPLSMDYPTIPGLPEVFIGKFSDIFDNENKHATSEELCDAQTLTSWREPYQDAVLYTDWLKKKDIYQSNSSIITVEHNFLYVLCRLLNEYRPKNILEFEFDQATKMTAQYATTHESSLTVLANDRERVEHLMRCWGLQWNNVVIHGSELLETMENGNQGVVYQHFSRITQGMKYNLILLKSPLQKDVAIHLDVLSCLPEILEDDFAILMDHVEDDCGKMVFKGMMDILKQKGIRFLCKDFPAKDHLVSVIFSESWKYIAEF